MSLFEAKLSRGSLKEQHKLAAAEEEKPKKSSRPSSKSNKLKEKKNVKRNKK